MAFNYKKTFLKNNFIVTVAHLLIYAKGILLLPILIKYLGVSIYGAYSLIVGYTGLIYGVSSLGIGFKYQRFIPSITYKRERSKLFYIQFYFQLISIFFICIILYFVNSQIKELFIKYNYSFAIIGGTIIMLFLYSQSTDYFRYTHRIKLFAIPVAINPYLNIIFIVLGIFFFKNLTIDFLLGTSILSMALLSLPLFIIIIKELGFSIPKFKIKEIYEDLKLGIPLMFSYVIDFLLAGSDRFVIGYYMTTREVGFYNPAYTLGSLIIMIPKVMGVVLPPILSKAVDSAQEKTASQLLAKSVKIYLIIAIPFIVGSLLLSKTILTLLTDKEIANAGFLISPIVALGILFYGLSIIIIFGIAFVKMKTKLIMYANLLAGILNISLNLVLLYFFKSIIISAIISMLCYFISFIFLHIKTRRLLHIEYNKLVIFKITAASFFMGIFLHLAVKFLISKLLILITIPISVIIYFSFLLMLKTFEKSEISFIKTFLIPKLD